MTVFAKVMPKWTRI